MAAAKTPPEKAKLTRLNEDHLLDAEFVKFRRAKEDLLKQAESICASLVATHQLANQEYVNALGKDPEFDSQLEGIIIPFLEEFKKLEEASRETVREVERRPVKMVFVGSSQYRETNLLVDSYVKEIIPLLQYGLKLVEVPTAFAKAPGIYELVRLHCYDCDALVLVAKPEYGLTPSDKMLLKFLRPHLPNFAKVFVVFMRPLFRKPLKLGPQPLPDSQSEGIASEFLSVDMKMAARDFQIVFSSYDFFGTFGRGKYLVRIAVQAAQSSLNHYSDSLTYLADNYINTKKEFMAKIAKLRSKYIRLRQWYELICDRSRKVMQDSLASADLKVREITTRAIEELTNWTAQREGQTAQSWALESVALSGFFQSLKRHTILTEEIECHFKTLVKIVFDAADELHLCLGCFEELSVTEGRDPPSHSTLCDNKRSRLRNSLFFQLTGNVSSFQSVGDITLSHLDLAPGTTQSSQEFLDLATSRMRPFVSIVHSRFRRYLEEHTKTLLQRLRDIIQLDQNHTRINVLERMQEKMSTSVCDIFIPADQ